MTRAWISLFLIFKALVVVGIIASYHAPKPRPVDHRWDYIETSPNIEDRR